MTKSKSKSKKSDKSKDINASGNVSESKTAEVTSPPTPSPSPVTVGTKNAPKVWFQSEIQSMMYAFGDGRHPSAESAMLIEEIVHQQISSMIVRAVEVTNMRGGRFMSIDDIIFLMRRDKDKLKRLIKYLTMKDMKNKVQKQTSLDDEEVLESMGDKTSNKRRKMTYDFLNTIDQTGDLISLFDEDEVDEVKVERNERAECLSRALDPQQYLEYSECRQVNFNKKAGKFREWIDCSSLIDMKPNTPVMEVFSFLAYETVAQLVDLALLVKKDMEGGDALTTAMPPVSALSWSQAPVITSTSTATSSTPSTPNHTPPGTPTTPTPTAASVPTPTVTGSCVPLIPAPSPTGSTGSTSSTGPPPSVVTAKPSKSKKRKIKSSAAGLPESSSDCIQPHHIRETLRRYAQYMGPMAPFSSSAAGLPESSSDCIQPHHIRETLRRYAQYMGPMAPFSHHKRPTPGQRTLCC